MVIKRVCFSLVLLTMVFALIASFSVPAAAQGEPPEYTIGPNDHLQVFVWKEPDLTRDVTVMADGRITFPLIGEIMAAGKTVNDLKKIITDKLKKFVTAPEVTVIVAESLSRQIYTIGKLTNPGPYPLAPNMTVLQALSAAGGFAEWADTKNIMIVRHEKGKEVQLRFNYKDFVAGKNLKQNIELRPNDTIVVP
ncbi:MAG: polysaccharide export protein [Thermoplasmata archaeon]|nr:MAG: polysaccharide export protein [Deltaproteobacteria bacterium]RLF60289.1 MAG: polysaccharide export protein [Thermoplasmata archaeon]